MPAPSVRPSRSAVSASTGAGSKRAAPEPAAPRRAKDSMRDARALPRSAAPAISTARRRTRSGCSASRSSRRAPPATD
jgi:hypothetical protein